MTNLFDPPLIFTLPLSIGKDLFCEFIYEPLLVDDDGEPILDGQGQPQYAEADYPDDAVVTLTIDAEVDVVGVADVVGSIATVLIDHALVDPLGPALLWRLAMTTDIDDILANGTTARSDGREPR